MSLMDDFFGAMTQVARKEAPERSLAVATVDPAYTSGAAKVTFDGETALSTRAYPILAAVAAGARVVMIKAGSTWLVLGQIGGPPGGGGGGSMTRAQIDALGVDAGTLDGIDSTGFATRLALDTVNAVRQGQWSLSFQNGSTGVDASWDGSNFKFGTWIAMATAGSHFGSQGEFEGPMPAVGTVIPGYGGSSGATVTASGIPIANWETLYAVPTLGGAYGAYSYAMVRYSTAFRVPDHWIHLAFRNGYDALLHLGNGQRLDYWRVPTLINGWSHYGGGWNQVVFRKDSGGAVHLRGMMYNGTSGLPGFVLPPGYRIAGTTYTPMTASVNGVAGRVDIYQASYSNGTYVNGVAPTASAGAWVSLESVPPFFADA